MRVTATNRISGTRESYWISWEQYENKLKVDEIEEEVERFFRQLQEEKPQWSHSAIGELNNIDNFTPNAIKHIFDGEINKGGFAVGYHYENLRNTEGQTIPWTKSSSDSNGVYSATVSIRGIQKKSNTTFYPKSWSPQQVIDSINEAYRNREFIEGSANLYRGSFKGMTIMMRLDSEGKIKTAYPKKGK